MKYKVEIAGGTFSVHDVLDELIKGTQTILNDGRVVSIAEEGSIESYGNGMMAGTLEVESDSPMPEDAVEQLKRQYPGIEFKVEVIA